MMSPIQSYRKCIRKMHESVEDHRHEDAILPLNSQKESFTTYVAHNINRKEETLSERKNFINVVLRFIIENF